MPGGGTVTALGMDDLEGLSGLGMDAAGALWMVPERNPVLVARAPGESAAAAQPAASAQPAAAQRWPVRGVPEGLDLESLTWLSEEPARVALGTEGVCERNTHAVLVAERRDAGFEVALRVPLPLDLWSASCDEGRGIEGLCAARTPAGTQVLAAVEHPERDERGRRVALVAHARWTGERMDAWQPQRVLLTSDTGKLSALDCAWVPGEGEGGAGYIDVWAVERHFEVARIVNFRLPLVAAGSSEPIAPTVAVDLADYIADSARNFEGLVVRDGRAYLIVDNHYGRRSGPNELLTLALPAAE
ncbi:hypothetical protein Hoch_3324 [Haliangium ochraceum DSM 14365]|uniref:Phytase-like domain-containing protein n=1 Tax=Haliangium ochraceum (strain DSM 14365 / JCM 11303 / SMP-2) TaxID=502025 RepID=D0LTY2_HALO1|nr:hypothetical protein Hoch_3324 [Haliangium ochraceum DSM 14365]